MLLTVLNLTSIVFMAKFSICLQDFLNLLNGLGLRNLTSASSKKPLICSVSGPNQHQLRLANLPGCSNTHADGAEIECRLFVGFRLSSLLVSQPLLVPGDLTDEETVKRTVEQTLAHYGRLDVLVNSAGILAMGGIETPDLAQYDRVMNINVRWDFCPTTEQNTRLKKKKTY